MSEALVNRAPSTLAAAITSTQLTFTRPTATTGWPGDTNGPASANFRVVVTDSTNYEIMLVTGGQGTTTLTVTRAAELIGGVQTAYAFASGSSVTPVATALGVGDANAIQGVSVVSTAPTTGQVLEYNGTDYAPATPSGGGSLDPQGGTLTIDVSMPNANTFYTIFTTPSLAVGTWLFQASLLYNSTAAADYVAAQAINGSGTASFSGNYSGESFLVGASDGIQVSLSCLAVVTVAGTFVVEAEATGSAGSIVALSYAYALPGVSGWTAIKVA